ncbi:hypothetical protein SDC9_74311 [bioreactor metagenome]|uniref:HXXEE domain-containing protein n=1 Tax=bioreactor metagenome TaxID=1076179 RepID=A0A644YHP3_9ZZZZ
MIKKLAENQNWAKAAPVLGIVATILLIVFTNPSQPIFWALVNIPLYFFHQTEEHLWPGGFKRYVNTVVNKLPDGEEKLTDIKVFWINILSVWIAFFIFGALSFWNIGFGLLLIIFSAINCLTHIGMALIKKEWNPGLVMSSLQMLLSIYGAYFLTVHGGIQNVALWWVLTIAFSVASHVAVFRLGMTT